MLLGKNTIDVQDEYAQRALRFAAGGKHAGGGIWKLENC